MRYITFIAIMMSFLGCSHLSEKCNCNEKDLTQIRIEQFSLEKPSNWGKTTNGDSLYAGGFSGLIYIGQSESGELQFLTHTDRGPNAEPMSIKNIQDKVRPFLMPDFQPRWVKLQTNSKNRTIEIISETLLTDPAGKPLTGLPQSYEAKKPDEVAVNLSEQKLNEDPMGVDLEGMTRDSAGNIWMVEEYRPSILKFNSQGRLLKRFIPKGSLSAKRISAINNLYKMQVIVDNLPASYQNRRSNRGFEGVQIRGDKLFAIMQSAIELKSESGFARILEFDLNKEKFVRDYKYPFLNDKVDKIGDLSFSAPRNIFYAIEQNGVVGKDGLHWIRGFTLDSKTQKVEGLHTLVSLADFGYDFAEKVEGLAMISSNQMAVINDNDFGLNSSYSFPIGTNAKLEKRKSVLAIIYLPGQLIKVEK